MYMYVCIFVNTCVYVCVSMHVCTRMCMYACTYARMYVRMYVRSVTWELGVRHEERRNFAFVQQTDELVEVRVLRGEVG